MNASTVARAEQLHPALKVKAYQLIQQLSLQGIDVEICQGLRTWPQQEALYAQGRTAPGSIVTHAKGGESYHCYGLAFDFDIQTPSGIDWTGNDKAWNATIAAGESLGLFSGSEWQGSCQDRPHFQLTGPFSEVPDDEIKYLFAEGGFKAVWDAVDKYYASLQT